MMRHVGSSDLRVFPLGLGGNTFGMTTDTAASELVLDAFVDGGGNLIDTADSYAAWVPGNKGGESETIIGEWMRRRGNRGSVIIATKVAQHPEFLGLAPETIARAADASLTRLQTDYIDLYYAHSDDESRSIPEIAAAFDALVKAGKIRAVAISNLPPERITEWLHVAELEGFARPVALQPQYNLVSRHGYEQGYAPLAEAHHLAVFPYFSLASGFLTGKYRTEADLEGAARGPMVEAYLSDDGLKVVEALDVIASAHGVAISTVALAWLLAKPAITAPLASATTTGQLQALLAAAALTLTPDDIASLDAASRPFA